MEFKGKPLKVLYIGNFGKANMFKGSQVKKTISIYKYLKAHNIQVAKINTAKFDKFYFPLMLIKLLWSLIYADKIIVSLNKNGLKFANYMILKVITFFGNKKLYFITIGGWLASFIEQNKVTQKYFSQFERIYVQTKKIQNDLNILGLNNITNMKNFRDFRHEQLTYFKEKVLLIDYLKKKQIRLVFFASIRKEKGLEVVLNAINELNKKYAFNQFTLDIIGPVKKEYQREFNEIVKKNQNIARYKGIIIDQNMIYETLNSYDFMVFPTYYEGEGFPTVIVESFISGLPVLASDWKYNGEIIKDEYNGLLFKTNDIKQLVDKLEWIYLNRSKIKQMRLNCLEHASKFHPDNILKPILDDIKGGENFDMDY